MINRPAPSLSVFVAGILIRSSCCISEREQAAADMLSQAPVRGELFQKAKVKSLKMTTLIVIAFIICWTPYYVIFLAFTFAETSEELKYASQWIFCFGTGVSLVNPLIYGAFHVCSKSR